MFLDRNHGRLRFIADRPERTFDKPFRQGADQFASSFLQMGLLKSLLLADGRAADAAAILVEWLGKEFAPEPESGLTPLPKTAAAKGPDAERLVACVRDLLALDDQAAWRLIEEETAAFLAQLKLYAKAKAKQTQKSTSPEAAADMEIVTPAERRAP